MDAEILRLVGQVAGIGGVSLGVLMLLFRDVIRKKIFPTLTKEQAYKLLRLILVLVWHVALTGIGAWVWVSRIPANTSTSARPPEVIGGIVRYPQTKSHWPCFPRLDFKVWNPGSTVAFVTSAHLTFRRLSLSRTLCPGFGSHYPATADRCYTIMLDSAKESQDLVVPVAQVAPANGVDRFEIVVGVEGEFDFEHKTVAEYEVRGYLEYNNGMRTEVGAEKLRIVREVHTLPSSTGGPVWNTQGSSATPALGGCEDPECAS